MKRLSFVITFLFVWTLGLAQQDELARKYGAMISEDELRYNLGIIASDAMEGRETGKRGQKMAAAFISTYFKDLGLIGPVDGGYFQPLDLYGSAPGEIYVKAGDQTFQNYTDIIYFGQAVTDGEQSTPLVFAGKGREEDYNGLDVKGKSVLISLGSTEDYRAPAAKAREKGAGLVFVQNTNTADEFKGLAGQFRSFMGSGRLSLTPSSGGNTRNMGVVFVSSAATEKFMGTSMDKLQKAAAEDPKKGALKKVKPGNVAFKLSTDVNIVKSENVLGFLEGTDKKEEILVITAHYDHIGIGGRGEDKINNGADDDGSGTVAVMEMARVFTEAAKAGHRPRRSILFMTVTGEEKGLLGSAYYAANPIFPLENTIVNINIDMIGRIDSAHKQNYIYVIGPDKLSKDLYDLHEQTNKKYSGLTLDYTYNSESHPDRIYYRSDHWNFAKNGIPIIFYFSGIHEDYHRPSDEVDKIEFPLMTKRAALAFYTAWEIANREQSIIRD
ncbi:MAG TPA: M28 family peptidase [Cyclobacteriaceae bacterium]|nr:M28 family peptidase [Cyclobacteriaceae bacterium]